MKNYFLRKFSGLLFAALILSVFVSGVFAQNMFRKVCDFDGDGKTDFVVTRTENGLKIWYVWQSTDGFRTLQWGTNFDRSAAGDYDGDGKTDFAVYRGPDTFPPLYTFYILQSQTNSLFYKSFTSPGFVDHFPMHQDYDGDGKTDPAIWLFEFGLSSHISVHSSMTNSTSTTTVPPGDAAIKIGDMDGDGKADKAHYTLSNNVVKINNSSTGAVRTVHFGSSNDIYFPADFDGDGAGDLTVWRRAEGNWYWLKSSDSTMQSAHWGVNGDIPVPGDYDGDGKTDLAIWRAGQPQSHYWVNGSQSGVSVFAWGLSTDAPVRY